LNTTKRLQGRLMKPYQRVAPRPHMRIKEADSIHESFIDESDKVCRKTWIAYASQSANAVVAVCITFCKAR
jgi:hypothetical protein